MGNFLSFFIVLNRSSRSQATETAILLQSVLGAKKNYTQDSSERRRLKNLSVTISNYLSLSIFTYSRLASPLVKFLVKQKSPISISRYYTLSNTYISKVSFVLCFIYPSCQYFLVALRSCSCSKPSLKYALRKSTLYCSKIVSLFLSTILTYCSLMYIVVLNLCRNSLVCSFIYDSMRL